MAPKPSTLSTVSKSSSSTRGRFPQWTYSTDTYRCSFQVAPAELENVLCTHDDIADAGVTSVYDDSQATELPRAYVVLQGQAAQSVKPEDLNDSATTKKAEEIVKWVSGKVARHKQLRGGVVIIKEIPKSASGKILRRELKLRAKKEYESGGKSKL